VIQVFEPRLHLWAVADYVWPATDLTYSFMRDGTLLKDGQHSAMYAHMQSLGISVEVWQGEFRRAVAQWDAASPLTFTEVSDDGSPQGTAGLAQGDQRFGDIRIGAGSYEVLAFAWYPSRTTLSGDIQISTRHPFHVGTPFDLFSLFLHESGHSVGLRHSSDTTSVMSTTSTRVLTGLSQDDRDGIAAAYPAASGGDDGTPDPEPDPDQPPTSEPPPPTTKPGKGKGGGKGRLMALFSETRVSVLWLEPDSVLTERK
jgi:hypothetical protein